MASGHASRQWLEAVKFTLYVATPIAATIYLGTGAYPYLEKIIHNVRSLPLLISTTAPFFLTSDTDFITNNQNRTDRLCRVSARGGTTTDICSRGGGISDSTPRGS